jgi:hypothetical protein
MARSRTPLSVPAGGASNSFAGLDAAERRRAAFVPVGYWPFHSVHRIAGDSVAFAEVIKERGQRREVAPNCGRSQIASFHVLAPGNDMRSTHGTQTHIVLQSGKLDKLPYIFLINAACFQVRNVRHPFLFGRNIGEVLELRTR